MLQELELTEELLRELTPDKITADQFELVLRTLRSTARPEFSRLSQLGPVSFDCCGTGGSGKPRFNTSTAVAFVLAAGGVKVAKFGNRAASSKSGSFDVLAHLGFPAEVDAEVAKRLLDECELVFLYAPQVYPSLGELAAVRKRIGTPTVLNFVGPLLNPVKPARRIVGVSHSRMAGLVDQVLKNDSDVEKAFVVRSACGLDEICPACENVDGDCSVVGSVGAEPPTPEMNAGIMVELFSGAGEAEGEASLAPTRTAYKAAYELVCANAAAAFVIAGRVKERGTGYELAQELLRSGAVMRTLVRTRECYDKFAK